LEIYLQPRDIWSCSFYIILTLPYLAKPHLTSPNLTALNPTTPYLKI